MTKRTADKKRRDEQLAKAAAWGWLPKATDDDKAARRTRQARGAARAEIRNEEERCL